MAEGTLGLIESYKHMADEKLAEAMAAAFVLVAMADGQLHMKEITRFYETLKGPGPLNSLITDEFEYAFNKVHEDLAKNFELGYQTAADAIRIFKGRTEESEIIVKLAQAAAVADDFLKDIENQAIIKICEMLGLNPANF